jgi:hypothetical protein
LHIYIYMNDIKIKIILLISIIVGYIAIHRENPFWLIIESLKYLYTLVKFFLENPYTLLQRLSSIKTKASNFIVLIGLTWVLLQIADLLYIIAEYLVKISNLLNTILIQNTLIIDAIRRQRVILNNIETLNTLIIQLNLEEDNYTNNV